MQVYLKHKNIKHKNYQMMLFDHFSMLSFITTATAACWVDIAFLKSTQYGYFCSQNYRRYQYIGISIFSRAFTHVTSLLCVMAILAYVVVTMSSMRFLQTREATQPQIGH